MNADDHFSPPPKPSSWSSPSATPGAPIDDEARKELLATLAASRDLGPEMDHTLAERYLERLTQRQARYAQYRARSRRLTATNLRRFLPLAIALAAGLGALMLMAVIAALALHGGPPPHFSHTGAGYGGPGGRYDGGYGPGGSGPDSDHDGGFFPLFGLFFWALPVLALILFLRRRAALRRGRYAAALGASRGPSMSGARSPYSSQPLPAAQSDDPYTPSAPYSPYGRYEPYQPYQPFDYATTSIPVSPPTRIFVEETSQPAPRPAVDAALGDDVARTVDGVVGADDGAPDRKPDAGQLTSNPDRSPTPPTGPLSNPAG